MRKRKRIASFFIWTFVFLFGAVAGLEILSRNSECSTARYSKPFLACESFFHADDAELTTYLEALSERYSRGELPSHEELDRAVIETSRDSIGGANGVYCNGVAFVSDDLPAQAELYVRRHELEHAFQFILQSDAANYESAANYAAAKEYPIGMAQTVIVSVVKARDDFDSTTCYIAALWRTFKTYFLPFMAR